MFITYIFDKLCTFLGKFIRPFSHLILIEYPRHRSESIGFEHISTRHRVAFMNAFNEIGCRII